MVVVRHYDTVSRSSFLLFHSTRTLKSCPPVPMPNLDPPSYPRSTKAKPKGQAIGRRPVDRYTFPSPPGPLPRSHRVY